MVKSMKMIFFWVVLKDPYRAIFPSPYFLITSVNPPPEMDFCSLHFSDCAYFFCADCWILWGCRAARSTPLFITPALRYTFRVKDAGGAGEITFSFTQLNIPLQEPAALLLILNLKVLYYAKSHIAKTLCNRYPCLHPVGELAPNERNPTFSSFCVSIQRVACWTTARALCDVIKSGGVCAGS